MDGHCAPAVRFQSEGTQRNQQQRAKSLRERIVMAGDFVSQEVGHRYGPQNQSREKDPRPTQRQKPPRFISSPTASGTNKQSDTCHRDDQQRPIELTWLTGIEIKMNVCPKTL